MLAAELRTMSRRSVYRGLLRRSYMGQPYQSTVILCRPEDWPEILGQIPEDEWVGWSTIDFGNHFLAIGPPTGPCLTWLAEHVSDGRLVPPRMATDRITG